MNHAAPNPYAPFTRRDKALLRILLDHPQLVPLAAELLDPQWVENLEARALLRLIFQIAQQPGVPLMYTILEKTRTNNLREALEEVIFSTDETLSLDVSQDILLKIIKLNRFAYIHHETES